MTMSKARSTTHTTTLTLDRPDGRLAYDVTGNGPLVVASPGLGDVRQTYRFLVDDLAAVGYRVATVDLRGHGGSSTGWPAHDETAIAEDLIALVEHLAEPGEKAVLVGNSYSGGAAVVAAARRPDLVAGLVLSGAFVRTAPRTPVQRLAGWLVTGTPLGRRVWTSYFPSMFPGRKPHDFAAYHAALKANLGEPGRFAAVAAMGAADHDAAEAALPEVAAPALVVMGDKDPDFADPAAEARLTAERLGGEADVVMVRGAGHYPHAEEPGVVSPAVAAFLSRTLPLAGGE